MKKLLISFIILLFCSPAFGADVTVGWTAPNDPRVTGYNVYVSQALDGLHDHLAITVTSPTITADITNLTVGQTYYFGVTSTSATAESVMSDVLHYTVTPPAQVIEVPNRPSEITIRFSE